MDMAVYVSCSMHMRLPGSGCEQSSSTMNTREVYVQAGTSCVQVLVRHLASWLLLSTSPVSAATLAVAAAKDRAMQLQNSNAGCSRATGDIAPGPPKASMLGRHRQCGNGLLDTQASFVMDNITWSVHALWDMHGSQGNCHGMSSLLESEVRSQDHVSQAHKKSHT
jgi:hypothetical protein